MAGLEDAMDVVLHLDSFCGLGNLGLSRRGAMMRADLGVRSAIPPKKEDAHKRAIEDYSQFSQYLRALGQFLFAANGGAAIAMLTCLTSLATSRHISKSLSVTRLLNFFSFATACFLGSLFLLFLSIFFFTYGKLYWGHFWERVAVEGNSNVDFGGKLSKTAAFLESIGFYLMTASIMAFLIGSCSAVAGFLP